MESPRGEASMKPRIIKIINDQRWTCHGSGQHSVGDSPVDAYCKWRLKVKPLMVEE